MGLFVSGALAEDRVEIHSQLIFLFYCVILRRCINISGYLASERNEGDNAGEMSPGSSTESYPAFARIGLRENPGKKPQPGVSTFRKRSSLLPLISYFLLVEYGIILGRVTRRLTKSNSADREAPLQCVALSVRRASIDWQSLSFHLSGPIFKAMLIYAWYASKLINEREVFVNVKDICFAAEVRKNVCDCGKPSFICCAWCRKYYHRIPVVEGGSKRCFRFLIVDPKFRSGILHYLKSSEDPVLFSGFLLRCEDGSKAIVLSDIYRCSVVRLRN
ncbi:hypothetical protein ANN_07111 [Periplaneta americana]|uniref:Uncharacterized protein n=1 Tax=Periplaneta americana TaxID=6978 RepID=A0ABQ8TH94_PERAM|nr:hypothetical protein ANN_07111 [Periplaneta americana]